MCKAIYDWRGSIDTRTIHSKKRDHFQRAVALRIDTFHCVMVPAPVDCRQPTVELKLSEATQYFALQTYVTFNGAKHGTPPKVEFFETIEARDKVIVSKMANFFKQHGVPK